MRLPCCFLAVLVLQFALLPVRAAAPATQGHVSRDSSAATAQSGSTAPAVGVKRRASRRLPAYIRPVSYDVTLAPDIAQGTFAGTEIIAVQLDKPSSEIWFHQLELKIDTPVVTGADGKVISGRLRHDSLEEMSAFVSDKELAPGTYTMRIAFSGAMSDKLRGLYLARYNDKQGKSCAIASTQMEPADARRMIPCFDEPEMKACFKLTVRIKPELEAVSNSPVSRTSLCDGQKIVEFSDTPPMSTYLLALVVGDLEATPEVSVEGIPIRVWAVKGMGHLGGFGRDAAARLLPWMNDYFGVAYPWKKLDLIAVPDFAAGAMENPGAITFRETLLLIDPTTSSTGAQKRAVGVIAHEMAHMWFGDLVTMQWWDDLWLNEAFATWMATKSVDAVYPQWQTWKGYVYARVQALKTDSLNSTRAIAFAVKSPEQIHEMFDVITYEKGAAVLRMLERHVGEDVFKKGVQAYIRAHRFGNAVTADLWQSVSDASGIDCASLMKGWVYQAGYPLVSIARDLQSGKLNVTQKRFVLSGLADTGEGALWEVPLGLRRADKDVAQDGQTAAQVKVILDDERASLSAADSLFQAGAAGARDECPPIIANAGGVGYFRVRYDDCLFAALVKQPSEHFDPAERLALLDDSSELMQSGEMPVKPYLELITRYRGETDEAVWGSIIGDLNYFDRFIDERNRPAFERFVRAQLTEIYKRLGLEPAAEESPQVRQLRSSVLVALANLGQEQELIKSARAKFESYLKDPTSVDRDIVSPVSSIVSQHGNAADYETFRQLYLNAATPESRTRNLYMLQNFYEPALAARTLELSLSKEIRLQDAPHLLGGLVRARETQAQAWKFVRDNWERIGKIFPEDMVPGVVSSAGNFNQQNQLDELRSFLQKNPVPSGKNAVERTLERVSVNVRFREKAAKDLNEWLQSNYGD